MKRRELMLLLTAAITAPRLLQAQQKGNSLVGVLDPTSGPHQSTLAAFREGLEDAGYDRGLVAIEYRWTDNRFDRMPALAADLVSCKVDVIVTGSFSGVRGAKAATSSIPIVFFGGSDLIEAGLIESPDRPGNNLTGIFITPSERDPKPLDLLSELVPQARVIAMLVNQDSKAAQTQIQEAQETARALRVQLQIVKSRRRR